jgi:hypothetical protein
MQVSLATAPARPDMANEDFAAVGTGSAVLLDGAGVPEGAVSGCSHGVEWFTRNLGVRLLAAIASPDARPMTDCLAEAIAEVRALHEHTCDLSHAASPSATAVAVRVRPGTLEYLVLADSVLVLDNADGRDPVVICDDREAQVGASYRAAMDAAPIGTQAHRHAYRDYIAAMQERRNKPGGFWVASADPGAAECSLTGSARLPLIESALLLSDGAARLARFGQASWSEMVKIVTDSGPDELIRRTRTAEESDPAGERWPRGKAHDDATVVCATALSPPSRLRLFG